MRRHRRSVSRANATRNESLSACPSRAAYYMEFIKSLSTEREDHAYRCLNLRRLVVEPVRLVAPGPQGLEGRLTQHDRSAYNVHIFDSSGLGNCGLYLHS